MRSDECPDQATWRRYASAPSNDDERRRLDDHLRSCPPCRSIVDETRQERDATGVGLDSWDAPVPPPVPPLEMPTAAHGAPGAAPAVRGDRPGPDGGADGRYEICRLHAQGGLGEVFLARDLELERQVAVKRIRTELTEHPEIQSRFLREAKLTGALEHPGIVPIYGLLRQADGRPLYAMRWIRGTSLRAQAERFHSERPRGASTFTRQDRDLRQLLGHLISVCQAAAYAHSQGVVHRDIKPDNIMCGEFGETLLVDWGLAKRVDAESESDEATAETSSSGAASPTANPGQGESTCGPRDDGATTEGVVVGTPHYMSPEQAAGAMSSVGPTSDVYSLGATLYFLLTGQAPHEGRTTAEVLDSARRGGFPTPRQRLPSVPAALDAVCRRALAHIPAERYATPQSLADDLECWLADEPLTVHRESLARRAARWLRKHPRWSSGGLAALLVGAVALTVSLSIFGVLNHQLEQTNQKLTTTNSKLSESRRLAEQRAELAMRTLESVVFQVQSRLSDVPGSLKVRQEILITALQGLRELRAVPGLARRRDAATALTLTEIGDLLLRHGATLPEPRLVVPVAGPNDPSAEYALEAYTQAIEIYAGLVAENPANVAAEFGWAVAEEKRADALHLLARMDESRRHYEQALAVFRRVAERVGPQQHEYLGPVGPMVKLALSHYQGAQRHQALEDCLRRARARYQAAPTDPYAERFLGIALTEFGSVVEDAAERRRLLEAAVRLYRRQIEAMPDQVTAQRDLTRVLVMLHYLDLEDQRWEDAQRRIEEAVRISIRLSRLEPESTMYRDALLGTLTALRQMPTLSADAEVDFTKLYLESGIAAIRSGQFPSAIETLELAEGFARLDLQQHPETSKRVELSDVLVWLADARRSAGQGVGVSQLYEEARSLLEAVPADETVSDLQNRRYNVAWRLADAHAAVRHWEDAQRCYSQSTSIAEHEWEDRHEAAWKRDLVWVLERHAAAAENEGLRDLAISLLRRALAVLQPGLAEDPASPDTARARDLEQKLAALEASAVPDPGGLAPTIPREN